MIGFRLAQAQDVEAIGLLIEQCLNETPNRVQIGAGIGPAVARAVTLAVNNEEVVGFVAGFKTLSPDEVQRWEIDLLAVRPAEQRQGIGRQLINASVERGRGSGAVLARAIIQENNAASQRAFASQGFIASKPMELYTWRPSQNETLISRFNVINEAIPGIIPVSTFTYTGLWLEGELTESMIQTAKHRAFMEELDTVGALVPKRQSDVIKLLERWRFKYVNPYRSWQKRF